MPAYLSCHGKRIIKWLMFSGLPGLPAVTWVISVTWITSSYLDYQQLPG